MAVVNALKKINQEKNWESRAMENMDEFKWPYCSLFVLAGLVVFVPSSKAEDIHGYGEPTLDDIT